MNSLENNFSSYLPTLIHMENLCSTYPKWSSIYVSTHVLATIVFFSPTCFYLMFHAQMHLQVTHFIFAVNHIDKHFSISNKQACKNMLYQHVAILRKTKQFLEIFKKEWDHEGSLCIICIETFLHTCLWISLTYFLNFPKKNIFQKEIWINTFQTLFCELFTWFTIIEWLNSKLF